MTTPSNSTPSDTQTGTELDGLKQVLAHRAQRQPTDYTLPIEVLQAADRLLAGASPDELARAAALYKAYGVVTDGRSAVTGSELPDFDICRPLVKAGSLSVVRATHGLKLGTATIHVDATARTERLAESKGEMETLVESGVHLPAAARNLAEARALLMEVSESDPVRKLIARVATALHDSVGSESPSSNA